MSIGLLTLHIHLPGCTSLKEKRSRLKPMLARLHREFNISVAEINHQDAWSEAVIACAVVSNDPNYNQQALQHIIQWIEASWPDATVFDESIEII
jgi:hypothetical protein